MSIPIRGPDGKYVCPKCRELVVLGFYLTEKGCYNCDKAGWRKKKERYQAELEAKYHLTIPQEKDGEKKKEGEQ